MAGSVLRRRAGRYVYEVRETEEKVRSVVRLMIPAKASEILRLCKNQDASRRPHAQDS